MSNPRLALEDFVGEVCKRFETVCASGVDPKIATQGILLQLAILQKDTPLMEEILTKAALSIRDETVY